MKNLADVKRAMQPGIEVDYVNHVYPELTGKRKLLRTRGGRWELRLPKEHHKYKQDSGSWLEIPKASDVKIEGNSFTITNRDPGWTYSGPFCTITINLEEKPDAN